MRVYQVVLMSVNQAVLMRFYRTLRLRGTTRSSSSLPPYAPTSNPANSRRYRQPLLQTAELLLTRNIVKRITI